MKTGETLTLRQQELLRTLARARRTTLLRWAFYLKLIEEGPDLLGHPDLYGHEIEVVRDDMARLCELGLMRRFPNERGYIEDCDITDRGLAFDRRMTFQAGVRRTAWFWLPAFVIVNVAMASVGR